MSTTIGGDDDKVFRDRQWWQGLGQRLGLGRLSAFTDRHSALFIRNGQSMQVEGALVEALSQIDRELLFAKRQTT